MCGGVVLDWVDYGEFDVVFFVDVVGVFGLVGFVEEFFGVFDIEFLVGGFYGVFVVGLEGE